MYQWLGQWQGGFSFLFCFEHLFYVLSINFQPGFNNLSEHLNSDDFNNFFIMWESLYEIKFRQQILISVYYPFINKKFCCWTVCRVLQPLWRLIICSKLSKVILKIAHSYRKPLKLLQTKKLAKAGWEEINIYTCFTVPVFERC